MIIIRFWFMLRPKFENNQKKQYEKPDEND